MTPLHIYCCSGLHKTCLWTSTFVYLCMHVCGRECVIYLFRRVGSCIYTVYELVDDVCTCALVTLGIAMYACTVHTSQNVCALVLNVGCECVLWQ